MQKTLITGGVGFIGLHVVEELRRHGHEVFVLDNLSFGRRGLLEIADDHFFKVDLRDKAGLAAVLNQIKPDAVVHLAAIHFIPYCNQHPYEAAEVNIGGTINLFDAIKQTPSVQRILFASTAAVYPIHDDPLAESHESGPLDIYGLTKHTGEYLCRGFSAETGLPVTRVRFFNAFGTKETNPHLIPEIQKQVLAGVRKIKLGNLEPKRDYIHTTDMASAMRLLLARKAEGCEVFNLGSGLEYSVREVVDAFSAALGEAIEIEVDPARVRKVDRPHLVADIRKLKAAIDWKPLVSLENGIREILKEDRTYDRW
jgi:UDP-glucose 4-epimerase